MPTLNGFRRWLATLRRLNAQRDAIDRQAGELADVRLRLESRLDGVERLQIDHGARLAMIDRRQDEQRTSLGTVQSALESLRARVELESEQASAVRNGVRGEIQGLGARIDALARTAQCTEDTVRRIDAVGEATRERVDAIAPPFPALPGLSANDTAAWLHAAVEARFRGPSEDIRERLRIYLPFLAKLPAAVRALAAVDVGCGRGEWLELLREADITAVGVDDNPVSVERCKSHGLDARRTDALVYLRAQADEGFAVVSAFHVIEHLAPEHVMALLFESQRILAPGGLLLLETPNPDNLLVGASSFHLDPTHRHPIPLALLRTLVEFARFEVVETLALQPDDAMRDAAAAEQWPATLARLLGGARDSGIVARKPEPPTDAASI